MSEPTACPVAAAGRQIAALIRAVTASEERQFDMGKSDPERSRLERLDEHTEDHRDALEAFVAGLQATSLEGAAYQVMLASSDVDSLRQLAEVREKVEAGRLGRRLDGYLHSVLQVLLQNGAQPDPRALSYYMAPRFDPHPTIRAALAGEPIPPAPDGDE
jgi:hypothetical protein